MMDFDNSSFTGNDVVDGESYDDNSYDDNSYDNHYAESYSSYDGLPVLNSGGEGEFMSYDDGGYGGMNDYEGNYEDIYSYEDPLSHANEYIPTGNYYTDAGNGDIAYQDMSSIVNSNDSIFSRIWVQPHFDASGNYVSGHWEFIKNDPLEVGGNMAESQAYNPDLVHVDGYTRDDGTYVQGHVRTAPDGIEENNLSYR